MIFFNLGDGNILIQQENGYNFIFENNNYRVVNSLAHENCEDKMQYKILNRYKDLKLAIFTDGFINCFNTYEEVKSELDSTFEMLNKNIFRQIYIDIRKCKNDNNLRILNNIKKINLDNDFKNLSFIFTIHLVSLILIRVFSIYIFRFESYENNFMIQVLLNIAFIIYEMYMVSKLMSKLKNNITIKKRSSRIKKSPINCRVIDIEQYKNMNK